MDSCVLMERVAPMFTVKDSIGQLKDMCLSHHGGIPCTVSTLEQSELHEGVRRSVWSVK